MADNLRKYTTQEVLNKVYTDSSGDSIGINSSTTKETLNAVFDETDNSLNVALSGGTISGDVTISGDLTVNGNGTGNYDEIVNGNLVLSSGSKLGIGIGDADPASSLEIKGSTNTLSKITLTNTNPDPDNTWSIHANYNSQELKINGDSTNVLTLSDTGNVGIGTSPQSGWQSSYTALQLSNSVLYNNGGNDLFLGANFYFDGSNNKYITANGRASAIGLADGALKFFVSSSTTHSADDNVSFNQALTIDTSGNVIVGQTSGQQKLEVHGGGIRIAGNISTPSSGVTGALIDYFGSDTRFWSRGADASTVGSFKFIGLENDGGNQSTQLEINSSGEAIFADKINAGSWIQVNNNNTLWSDPSTGVFIQSPSTTQTINFRNNSSQVGMVYDASAFRMGIGGNHTPSYPLHVENAGDTVAYFKSTDNNGQIAVVDDDTTAYFGANGSRAFMGTASGLAGTTNLVVDSNGNTGIGTTSPVSKMHIEAGSLNANGGIHLTNDDTGQTINDGTSLFVEQNTKDFLIRQRESANVIIMTSADSKRMIIDDNSRISLSNNDSGTGNTIFGKSTATSLDAGSNYNVLIGGSIATGSMNDANHNVAVGSDALQDITSGDNNVAIGSSALLNITSGERNVVIGRQAGQAMTTANRNTAVGYQALYSEDADGDRTIAIGHQALYSQNGDTEAMGNTAVGYISGFYNVTGTNNTYMGYGSGGSGAGSTNSHSDNTGIGYKSLEGVTTGGENVALGSLSGQYNQTGNRNTYVGYASGLGASGNSNSSNVGLGYFTLKDITTGGANTVVGAFAGDVVTTQDSLTLVGKDAGSSINHNDANGTTAIGAGSLALLTNGRQNTAVGYGALETTANGDRNTAVGHLALGNVTGGNDGDNTGIGHNAGHDGTNDLTSGTKNTLIGSSTRVSSATAVNQTVIGYNAIGAGDNSVVLGDSDVSAVLCASDGEAQLYASAIRFPATQVANSNANALDDYEEGNFTVTIISGDGTGAISAEEGEYVKVGKVVHFRIVFTVSANFTNTGIDGLPFQSTNSGSPSSIVGAFGVMTSTANDEPIFAGVSAGTTQVYFYSGTNASDSHTPNTGNLTYRFAGTYFAS